VCLGDSEGQMLFITLMCVLVSVCREFFIGLYFLILLRAPRSTHVVSSAASDVYKIPGLICCMFLFVFVLNY
ncbi:hypothetical protein PT309_00885, partial [Metamycoplasma hyosynoviae]|uniref:hypothetical protein n=1 Tax=Metamycoplasma hyosynoviae TaxID=29559 RepID=UPI002363047C